MLESGFEPNEPPIGSSITVTTHSEPPSDLFGLSIQIATRPLLARQRTDSRGFLIVNRNHFCLMIFISGASEWAGML